LAMEHLNQGRYSTLDVRVRAVEAISRGLAMGKVAEAYGIDRTTLYRWVTRSKTTGLGRKIGSGRPRLLGTLTEEDLVKLVLKPATAYGYETDLWTIGRLHRVIQEEFETVISQDTIWRRLREAGLTYQKPERQYFQMDEEARKEWMRVEAPKIRRCVRKHKALLYFQDEANVSLTAFLGKTWAPRGKTPRQKVTGSRGGVAAISAINGLG